MKPLLALVLVLMAGCVPEADSGPPQRDSLTTAERAACTDRGGVVAIAGMLGGEFCAELYPDAGQSCSRAADCEGYCDATSRTCSTHANPFGCRDYLDDDGSVAGICAD